MKRIYLSPPDLGRIERELLLDAFDSGWAAPLGPHVDAFEAEVAAAAGVPYAVALSSGTAGLHLALSVLGIGRGDVVLTSTLTFSATANAITYVGAEPVFIDASAATWTMDPDLLEEEISAQIRAGRKPAAVITVDLYGQCCDYDRIEAICRQYDIALIEDAAEALGATYRHQPAGRFGDCAVFSFNGNKILTTSGGGMLVSRNRAVIDRARHLATQAREPVPHYEHVEIGFNYRLSNLLAAVGRGQLTRLSASIEARRAIRGAYRAALAACPGIAFLPEAEYGRSNAWLTCITIDPDLAGTTREELRVHLDSLNVESRPVWKPMHLQPVFRGCRVCGGGVSRALFQHGLCLPSGSAMTAAEQSFVIAAIEQLLARGSRERVLDLAIERTLGG
jgi:dTDP-4-amino-4,6-dideoxygalactose transaminase